MKGHSVKSMMGLSWWENNSDHMERTVMVLRWILEAENTTEFLNRNNWIMDT